VRALCVVFLTRTKCVCNTSQLYGRKLHHLGKPIVVWHYSRGNLQPPRSEPRQLYVGLPYPRARSPLSYRNLLHQLCTNRNVMRTKKKIVNIDWRLLPLQHDWIRWCNDIHVGRPARRKCIEIMSAEYYAILLPKAWDEIICYCSTYYGLRFNCLKRSCSCSLLCARVQYYNSKS